MEVRFGQPVTAIDPDAVTVGTRSIAANTIVWAAGVQASPLGTLARCRSSTARGGCSSTRTSPSLAIPRSSSSAIWLRSKDGAAGHCRAWRRWQCRREHGRRRISCVRWRGSRHAPFRYRDLGNMATIGRNAAVADIRGLRLTGFVAWLAWAFVHILNLIGFRNRVLVAFQWLWDYLTFQRGARLITEAAR